MLYVPPPHEWAVNINCKTPARSMAVTMSPPFTNANPKCKGSNHQTLSELVNQIFDYYGLFVIIMSCMSISLMTFIVLMFSFSRFSAGDDMLGDGDVMLLTSLLSYVSSALSNFSIVFGHHSSKFNLNEISLSIVILS